MVSYFRIRLDTNQRKIQTLDPRGAVAASCAGLHKSADWQRDGHLGGEHFPLNPALFHFPVYHLAVVEEKTPAKIKENVGKVFLSRLGFRCLPIG